MPKGISFGRILADEERPLTVVVKRPGVPVRNELNEDTGGGEPVVAATLTRASIQPVSSETARREAGQQVRSTHELFCEPCECRDGYLVEATDSKGVMTAYTINGDPKDFGTHLEVTLVCPTRS